MGHTGDSKDEPLEALLHMVTHLPAEQRIFLTGQLSALVLAFLFRWYLPPSTCGSNLRHTMALLLGICLSLYCFGWLALFLLGEVVLGYLLLLFADPRRVHVYTLLLTMGYLTIFHIRRFVYPAEDELDFTVPLMMLTQKISRVAFEFHDGTVRTDQSLSPSQRHLAIRSYPPILTYFSYTLGFLGLLAGPVCSFNDYQIFIQGAEKWKNPGAAVCKKLCLCSFLLAAHLMLSDRFILSDDPHHSLIGRYFYLYLAAFSRRPKYYFAWTLADAINNAAGFGFNGFSEDGTEKWDRLSNLDIMKIETASSFKTFIDNWNIQTAVWLKEVCYDRSPYNPLLATFALSAVWHGVHPGYYLTFLTAVPITLAARRVRSNIRPWFQATALSRAVYGFGTWLCTQVAMSYTVAPFLLLELGQSLQLYRSVRFSFHILPILVLLILPKNKTFHSKVEGFTKPECDRNYNHLKKES
ncbi:lysophospholipid acyltransferase 2-like [Spea bombifrons]|uniref:lysophospholipid acyltransferase 2-like n=1 Tax=Spea bombifrons TaxID=233779 RepID=UPI0023495B0A|nr:lysophospholipid acyltransferase 2-like [Spea bombifrons]